MNRAFIVNESFTGVIMHTNEATTLIKAMSSTNAAPVVVF
jgi:hypothetical protein